MLRDQLLDIKEPTALQSAGQRYGEWVARREEMKRAVRPRGPIEYLGRRATTPREVPPLPPQNFQEGGKVENLNPWESEYVNRSWRADPGIHGHFDPRGRKLLDPFPDEENPNRPYRTPVYTGSPATAEQMKDWSEKRL